MAEDAGHELLYSPPHYSVLQPIATIWAIIKGAVGRQYTTTTTFKEILIRTNESFPSLQSQTVQGCIKKLKKNLGKLRQHIVNMERMDDDTDDNDDNDDGGGMYDSFIEASSEGLDPHSLGPRC